MMTLLRSRQTMYILAAVAIGGLIIATGIGLIQAMVASSPSATPPPPEEEQGQQGQGEEGGEEVPETEEPPEVADLGEPPSGFAYESEEEDVHCESVECVRLVEVVPESEGADADTEEIIDEVYGHLLSQDWGQILPEGAESPEDAENSEIIMTNDEIMLADSSDHTADSSAVLMVGHVPEDSDT